MNQRRLWLLLIYLLSAVPAFYAGADETLPDFNKVVQEVGLPPHVWCDTTNTSLPSAQDDQTKRWEQAGFKEPRIQSWSDSDLYAASISTSNTFTHGIEITTVVFRSTGWTTQEVKRRFQRMAEVYSQCGIKIQRADVIETDAPNGWIDVDDPYDLGTSNRTTQIAKKLPTANRPVFLFIRSLGNGDLATAEPPFRVGENSPRSGAVWMTSGLIPAEKDYPPNFSVEAHELGHILGNCSHDTSGKKNFLAGSFSLLDNIIQKDQCDVMKRNSSVRPL